MIFPTKAKLLEGKASRRFSKTQNLESQLLEGLEADIKCRIFQLPRWASSDWPAAARNLTGAGCSWSEVYLSAVATNRVNHATLLFQNE